MIRRPAISNLMEKNDDNLDCKSPTRGQIVISKDMASRLQFTFTLKWREREEKQFKCMWILWSDV
jgi:hypothetical protein